MVLDVKMMLRCSDRASSSRARIWAGLVLVDTQAYSLTPRPPKPQLRCAVVWLARRASPFKRVCVPATLSIALGDQGPASVLPIAR